MEIERVSVAGVGVDVVPPEEFENAIMKVIEAPGEKEIIFLNLWDLLKARHKGEFQNLVKNAALVLPTSKSILKGAAFLKERVPARYNPFPTVINILSILDSHLKSVFLLGSRPDALYKAKKNIKATYPNLKIYGSYPGYYKRQKEKDVITAIHKAAPSMVLYSEGIKDKVLWAYKRRGKFSSSVFLYYKDVIGIFSKRVKRINEKTFEKGHEFYIELLHNPLKVFFIFRYILYGLVLLHCRIKKNKERKMELKRQKKEEESAKEGGKK